MTTTPASPVVLIWFLNVPATKWISCHFETTVADQTCSVSQSQYTVLPMDLPYSNRTERRISRFFTLSSLCGEPFPTRTLKWPGRNREQIKCNTSSAFHVQHVVLRATWYEGTDQLLSLTEFKSHLIEH